ncbi:Glu/Leu/Phe/Val dehydrogenase dimerization domain-containing protein [Actinomadura madurae]|uniref:Glu/Leu/Phe/Val dehydrogenase dimerization domain-containing protein n=1 Tax=Actinomadura madurae TaxID=1993 RepID=UPI0027E2DEFD|nr:Glu/Leu/Phe/Val dehydrogenase dimerization domain-containing protein [Actinomadura madurae]
MPNVFGAPHKGTEPRHEQVVFCQDEASGLRAIIAIYSTALGPSLGGTRFYPYGSEEDALADVLNLSRGMAYKNALAGLDLGGGKAVIIGDPQVDKTEAKLRAYGRFVQSLNGRYYTACDVGTFSEDMDIVARECRFVTGRTVAHGGAGDSSILTAFGVFQGMRAAAETAWGSPTLRGKRVGVEGVGKVGHRLVEHLREDGADVVICDVNEAAVDRVRSLHPEVEVVADADAMVRLNLDVYAPCALGGSLNDDTVPGAGRQGGLRGREQPAGPHRRREAPRRPRRPVRARLRGELGRRHPGRGRDRGLQLRAGQGPRGRDLRHHPEDLRAGRRRGRPAGGGRGPARRAPDVRNRETSRHSPVIVRPMPV